MRLKIVSKLIPIIIIFFGIIISLVFFLYQIQKKSIRDSSLSLVENVSALSNQEPEYKEQVVGAGLPARLKIPVIHVDSAVVPVGVTPEGAMDSPKDPAEVAWFNLGPRPGDNGTAVFAGHYDWKNNKPAVFDALNELNIGDKISVEDEKGSAIVFVVREIKTYGKDEAAFDVFGSDDGKAHLNLVTCAGVWNKQFSQYSERLVIFSDREY